MHTVYREQLDADECVNVGRRLFAARNPKHDSRLCELRQDLRREALQGLLAAPLYLVLHFDQHLLPALLS